MAIEVTAVDALAAASGSDAFHFSDAISPEGVHVAVGYDPFMLMKKGPDGKWANVTSNLAIQMTDVIWTGSKFIAIGKGNATFHSSDGASWTMVSVEAGDWINICVDGNGVLVMVDGSGKVAKSVDGGMTWDIGDAGIQLAAVGFVTSLGLFVIAGNGDPVPVLASVDGSNWEALV